MTKAFIQLGVSEELTEQLHLQGIIEPTPVQKTAIPMLLNNSDVIAKAQTGTGKTLAFTLPILQQLRTDKEHIQALILTPTRELAIQITAEVKKLAATVHATVLAAYGGQDVDAQVKKLKKAPHIVVATPGRLIDHMRRGTISLGKVNFLVLDEADQMLHMGFLPEVESIIIQTPKARQTMLFSATMPDAIRQLATQYMKQPAHIDIKSTHVTLDNIKQRVIETTDRGKQDALLHLLQTQQPFLAVIFCRTKVRAKKLNEALQDAGYNSDELHGDLTQAKREQVMKRFRDMRLQILVATDVAARGLDVEGISHVYNYDIPLDAESYIHRIGRTGRAGHTGAAITFTTPHDEGKLAAIERGISARIPRRKTEAPASEGSSANESSRKGQRSGERVRRDKFEPAKKSGSNRKSADQYKPANPRAKVKSNDSRPATSKSYESRPATGKRNDSRPASDTARSKAPKRSNPWEISKADQDLAQGIKPRSDKKRPSRPTSTRGNSAAKPQSKGRAGGRSR